MPKMYNPDTKETAHIEGPSVKDRKREGFVVVGNRPESEYYDKSREELKDIEADTPEVEDQDDEDNEEPKGTDAQTTP